MLFANPGRNIIVEHCYFKNGGSGESSKHSVGIWFRGTQENMNIHIRYNTFENFERTGGTGYITLGWRGDPDTPTYSSGYWLLYLWQCFYGNKPAGRPEPGDREQRGQRGPVPVRCEDL